MALPKVLSQSQTDTDEPPKSDTFDKNVSRCNWECVVVNKSTDFVTEMKVRIGKYRILSLDLTVTKSADDRCLNQTAYSSSKLADAWMWSTVNPLTHERNGFDKPGNNCNGSTVTSFSKSVQGQIRGKVACTFNLSNDPATQQLDRLHSSINDLIGNVLMEEIKQLTEIWQSGAVLCYKETEQNSAYVCFSFNNRTSTESVEWPVRALPVLVIFIWIMFMLFSPVVFCLFTPTHICSVAKCVIVLKGPSHISIRGWIANFVSKMSSKLPVDNVGRKLFIVLVVTFIAIFSLQYGFHISFVELPKYLVINGMDSAFYSYEMMVASGLLWGIRGLFRVFCPRLSFVNPCFVCDYFKGEKKVHRVSEPAEEEIKQHLRVQPLIITKCLSLFWDCLKMYFRNCRSKLRCSWTAICQFVGLVLLIPIVLPVSLVLCLFSILVLVFHSCPMSTIFDIYVHLFIPTIHNRYIMSFAITILTAGFIFPYAGGVSFFLLILASLFIKAFTIILRLENIPYLTLLVLSISYCSSCYYSFTRKYDDLAAKLYSHLTIRVQQGEEIDNQHALYLEHNKKRAIPKYLFKRACKEVMPLGENFCKSLVNIFLVLVFFFLVFTIVMETPGVPDRMKITTAFLVAVIPKLIEIVVLKKGDKMEELEEQELDERIQSIVDEYYNNPVQAVGSCRNQHRLREVWDSGSIFRETGEQHGLLTEAGSLDHDSDSFDTALS